MRFLKTLAYKPIDFIERIFKEVSSFIFIIYDKLQVVFQTALVGMDQVWKWRIQIICMFFFRFYFPCFFPYLQIVIILALVSVISCLFVQSVFIYSLIYNYALITPNVERFSVYVKAIFSFFNSVTYQLAPFFLTISKATSPYMIRFNWTLL